MDDEQTPGVSRQVAECLACGTQVRLGAVDRSPTSDHFPTRMRAAARALAGALLAAGDAAAAPARAAAIELVETFSGTELSSAELDDDIRAHDREVRLVGELQLLAGILRPEAKQYLLRFALLLTTAAGPMTHEQGRLFRLAAEVLAVPAEVIERAAELAGVELAGGALTLPTDGGRRRFRWLRRRRPH
ncbi:MAG: hypothetical protein N2037_05585 [Acidimicrobiales bacterium]|nr:hypothetical protein [Acidimicrobiales bacterium]